MIDIGKQVQGDSRLSLSILNPVELETAGQHDISLFLIQTVGAQNIFTFKMALFRFRRFLSFFIISRVIDFFVHLMSTERKKKQKGSENNSQLRKYYLSYKNIIT